MERYLIINGDDFGSFSGSVEAVKALLLDPAAALTSSTIMAPCRHAEAACAFARANPSLGIGVHLTLTNEWATNRWSPLSDGSSLRGADGYMHRTSLQVEQSVDIREAERELRAQIEFCRSRGVEPSHIDNHMGSLYGIRTGRFELLQLTLTLAAEYRLPFRLPASILSMSDENLAALGIPPEYGDMLKGAVGGLIARAQAAGVVMPNNLIPSSWGGPQDESFEHYREYLYDFYASLPDGVTETYVHPCTECRDLREACDTWQHRVWEFEIMRDPRTRRHIEAHGIKLINYRDLARMYR